MITFNELGIKNIFALQLEDKINEDVEKIVKIEIDNEEKNGRILNDNEIKKLGEYIKLKISYKLINATDFVLPTDKIMEINKYYEDNRIVIDSIIARDGIQYFVNTTSIWAQGAVQKLHARYLVKTNIPKNKVSGESGKINDTLKRLSKIQKIDQDIYQKENSLEKALIIKKDYTDFLYQLESTKNPLFLENYYETHRWIKNKEYDIDRFKSAGEEEKEAIVGGCIYWIETYLKSTESSIKNYEKQIEKLNNKKQSL